MKSWPHRERVGERRIPLDVAHVHRPVAPVADGVLERGGGLGVREDRRLAHPSGAERLEVVEQQRPVADGEELLAGPRAPRATPGLQFPARRG